MSSDLKIYRGDSLSILKTLPDNFFYSCITSPPYYALRDYGITGQIGLEQTPEKYILNLVEIMSEVKRCLRDDGTCWINIGDTYVGTGNKKDFKDPKNIKRNGQDTAINNKIEGLKAKDLIGIPWMLAFALRSDGWYLRQDIIWNKTNAFPEPVKDRCTKSHEYIFLLSKNKNYYYDSDIIKETASWNKWGKHSSNKKPKNCAWNWITEKEKSDLPVNTHKNKRSVWSVPTKAVKSNIHIAAYPEKLIEPCVLASCPENGYVLDPFLGSGTTMVVCKKKRRNCVGIDLNEIYCNFAEKRLKNVTTPLKFEK